eukprot:6491761-Amphidinium_carterae.2
MPIATGSASSYTLLGKSSTCVAKRRTLGGNLGSRRSSSFGNDYLLCRPSDASEAHPPISRTFHIWTELALHHLLVPPIHSGQKTWPSTVSGKV